MYIQTRKAKIKVFRRLLGVFSPTLLYNPYNPLINKKMRLLSQIAFFVSEHRIFRLCGSYVSMRALHESLSLHEVNIEVQHFLGALGKGADNAALEVLEHTLVVLFVEAIQYLLCFAMYHLFFYEIAHQP